MWELISLWQRQGFHRFQLRSLSCMISKLFQNTFIKPVQLNCNAIFNFCFAILDFWVPSWNMSKRCFPEKKSFIHFSEEKACQLVGSLVVQLGGETHNRGQSSQCRWEASLDLIHICFLREVCCSKGLCSCSYCLVHNRNPLVWRPGARPAISYYHPLAASTKQHQIFALNIIFYSQGTSSNHSNLGTPSRRRLSSHSFTWGLQSLYNTHPCKKHTRDSKQNPTRRKLQWDQMIHYLLHAHQQAKMLEPIHLKQRNQKLNTPPRGF